MSMLTGKLTDKTSFPAQWAGGKKWAALIARLCLTAAKYSLWPKPNCNPMILICPITSFSCFPPPPCVRKCVCVCPEKTEPPLSRHCLLQLCVLQMFLHKGRNRRMREMKRERKRVKTELMKRYKKNKVCLKYTNMSCLFTSEFFTVNLLHTLLQIINLRMRFHPKKWYLFQLKQENVPMDQ